VISSSLCCHRRSFSHRRLRLDQVVNSIGLVFLGVEVLLSLGAIAAFIRARRY
jgi:hypothetical protein